MKLFIKILLWIPVILVIFVLIRITLFMLNINIKFPHKSIENQLKTFNAFKIALPDNLRPEGVEVGNLPDQFIIYASSEEKANPRRKEIFLIDSKGKIIDQQTVDPTCQSPFTVNNVGLIFPYCPLRMDSVFKVLPNKIQSSIQITAGQYNYTSTERIKHKPITGDESINTISNEIGYKHTCRDSWGSCYYINASLTIKGRELKINGYYLHDYLLLQTGQVVMIFGSNTTNYNETNELFILNETNE